MIKRNGYGFRDTYDILDIGEGVDGLDIYVEQPDGNYEFYEHLDKDFPTEDEIGEMNEDDFDTFVLELDLPDNWHKDIEEITGIKKTMRDLEEEPEIEASCSAELMDQISFI